MNIWFYATTRHRFHFFQAKVAELEDELENERALRSKAERARNDLERELEDLQDALDEQGGATQAQVTKYTSSQVNVPCGTA